MKRRLLWILTVSILCAVPVFSQSYEYGKPSDLKGLSKVFIDTGVDTETRERIVERILKAGLKDLTFLDSDEGAEIVLVFRDRSIETVTGAVTNIYGTTNVVRDPLLHGEGTVFVVGDGAAKPRVVLSVKNSQQSRAEKRPSTKFALAFVKAYKQANDLK